MKSIRHMLLVKRRGRDQKTQVDPARSYKNMPKSFLKKFSIHGLLLYPPFPLPVLPLTSSQTDEMLLPQSSFVVCGDVVCFYPRMSPAEYRTCSSLSDALSHQHGILIESY